MDDNNRKSVYVKKFESDNGNIVNYEQKIETVRIVDLENNMIEDDLKIVVDSNKGGTKRLPIPSINGVKLIGNKTTEELGIEVSGGGGSDVDLSTKMDKENPTGSGLLNIGNNNEVTNGNSYVLGKNNLIKGEGNLVSGSYNVNQQVKLVSFTECSIRNTDFNGTPGFIIDSGKCIYLNEKAMIHNPRNDDYTLKDYCYYLKYNNQYYKLSSYVPYKLNTVMTLVLFVVGPTYTGSPDDILDFYNIPNETHSDNLMYSTIEGYQNVNASPYSHVEGKSNMNLSQSSHMEGEKNITDGTTFLVHAEGYTNEIKSSRYTHIEGSQNNDTSGISNHIEGSSNKTNKAMYSHIEGERNNIGNGKNYVECTHIEGINNENTSSSYVHIEGMNHTDCIKLIATLEEPELSLTSGILKISGTKYLVSGYHGYLYAKIDRTFYKCNELYTGDKYTYLTVNYDSETIPTVSSIEFYNYYSNEDTEDITLPSHIEGYYNVSLRNINHTEGYSNINNSKYSHIEGKNNIAEIGESTHIEGIKNQATKLTYSHIEGKSNNIKNLESSHIEGANNSIMLYDYSSRNLHVEGENIKVTDINSMQNTHIEGKSNKFSIDGEGELYSASIDSSHIEGNNNNLFLAKSSLQTIHVEGEIIL